MSNPWDPGYDYAPPAIEIVDERPAPDEDVYQPDRYRDQADHDKRLPNHLRAPASAAAPPAGGRRPPPSPPASGTSRGRGRRRT